MKVLGIETSCDETSAAVVEDGVVRSNVISSQVLHNLYGGVVPEIASRIHIQIISQVVREALEQSQTEIKEIDGIAVTYQPGLIGSLVVGTNFAKGLSIRFGLPLIPIDHIEGHIYSGFLEGENLEFPFVTLVVSGGHTTLYFVKSFTEYEVVGATRDDAAGEAFDKIAKMLGLGYPGGPIIDKLSKEGNPEKYHFPRGLLKADNFDFSFSGLKTSVRYFLEREFKRSLPNDGQIRDICASVQSAIIEVLVSKSVRAVKKYNSEILVIAGGVSANSLLREKVLQEGKKNRFRVFIPKMSYCMDNAAMIAYLGEWKLKFSQQEQFRNFKFRANPSAVRAKRV